MTHTLHTACSLSEQIEMGHAALASGDFLSAIEAFETARLDHEDSHAAWRWAIHAMRRRGQFKQAAAVWRKAVCRFPESADIRVEGGWIVTFVHGPSEDTFAEWNGIRQTFPQCVEAHWMSVHEALQAGLADVGETIALEAYARFPTDRHVLWQWARSASQRQDFDEAARRWSIAQQMYPDMPQIRDGVGDLQFQISMRKAESRVSAASLPMIASSSKWGDLMQRFESVGDNCEFGVVQRLCGIEPLNLLRWANIQPDRLVAMLDNNFEGVGDLANVRLVVNNLGEYSLSDPRYFGMHTFIHIGSMEEASVLKRAVARLQFLSRNMREDMSRGSRILVMKSFRSQLSVNEIEAVFSAIQRRGPSKLLVVDKRLADGPSRLQQWNSDLFVASMPELTADPLAASQRLDIWKEICSQVA